MRSLSLLALLSLPLQGAIKPPDDSKTVGKVVPAIALTDERGVAFPLSDLKGKPLILSPFFASCPHTCSPISRSLLKVTRGLQAKGFLFNVLSLSFNPTDTVEDLKEFRKRVGLPPEWKVALGEKAAVQSLLRALDFQTEETEPGVFNHPNLVAITDGNLRLVKYVHGVELLPDEVELALLEAAQPQSPSLLFKLLISFGVLTLVLCILRAYWGVSAPRRSNP